MEASLPFHKAIRHFLGVKSRALTNHFTYTTKSGIAKGLKRRGGFGFLPRQVTEEEHFYLSLSLSGKVVYDIGANEGIFSLFSAREIGRTGVLVAFEPSKTAYSRLIQNLRLNNFQCRTHVLNLALGNEQQTTTMWCPSGETERSTINQQVAAYYKQGNEDCVMLEARVERLDDLVTSGLPSPDFMKIDTEGYEFEVLLGAENTIRGKQLEILVELHGTTHQNWVDNRSRVQSFLEDCEYQIFDLHRRKLTVNEPVGYLYAQPKFGKRE